MISPCERPDRNPVQQPAVQTTTFTAAYPSLLFGACFVYTPRGAGVLCEASRRLCARVKAVDEQLVPRCAGLVLRTSLCNPALEGLFTRETVLVPVPGCAPSRGAPSAALQLARALRAVGLAGRVWPGLERRCAVRRSATAPTGERPTVREHYESFCVARPPAPFDRILLVDDVITKGRTLFAAAMRLRDEFPYSDVRAFAFVRTLGFKLRLERLIEPCSGVIRWAGGDARREP
jgi:hypothetical protein